MLRPIVYQKQSVKGFSWKKIPHHIKSFINDTAEACHPDEIYLCKGGEKERQTFMKEFRKLHYVKRLKKCPNSFSVVMMPDEAEDIEKRIFTCTSASRLAVPQSKVAGRRFNQWRDISRTDLHLAKLYQNCMQGKKMYVVPFLAGPQGAPMSKFGVQITDSLYVVLALSITNKVGLKPLEAYCDDTTFIRAIHSNGPHDDSESTGASPCDIDNRILVVKPETDEIFSYGSSFHEYGACCKHGVNLRLASYVGKRDGWLASKMSVIGVQKENEKMYLGLVGPRGTGKTTTAVMSWPFKGYKVTALSDDSTWLWADEELRAVNPSRGICTRLRGFREDTTPALIEAMESNALFTMTGVTDNGSVYWDDVNLDTDDLNEGDAYSLSLVADDEADPSHPAARVMFPMTNLPNLDCHWESSDGVPISALVFFTRRSCDVPLIYEAPDAMTGLLMAAGLRNETVHAGTGLKHLELDPFGMRHHVGCNIGHHMEHWLKMIVNSSKTRAPKIFFVNNFIRGPEGEHMWPLGWSNFLLLEWIWKRMRNNDSVAVRTPIGYFPKKGGISFEHVDPQPEYQHLFPFSAQFWQQELDTVEQLFKAFIPYDLPEEYLTALHKLREGLKESDASGRAEQ